MWNIVALAESEVGRQIAIAAKRDSSIMMGITVGTLTFLPATAIAVSQHKRIKTRGVDKLICWKTIFAMPLLNWNAGPGQGVATNRFWIFLVVALPLTGLTLSLLFLWMGSINDQTGKPHFTSLQLQLTRLKLKLASL